MLIRSVFCANKCVSIPITEYIAISSEFMTSFGERNEMRSGISHCLNSAVKNNVRSANKSDSVATESDSDNRSILESNVDVQLI